MHVLVGLLGAAVIAMNLAEFFVTFLLPRRVKRDPRIARQFYRVAWRPWRWVASRLSPSAGDTLLGVFGPIGLLSTLALWTAGLVVGFAMLHWAGGSHLALHRVVSFGDDLYFSAGAFLSSGSGLSPQTAWSKCVFVAEAATGLAVVFIVVGYLPALFQAFSRREATVSTLDPRAGSPATPGVLLCRTAQRENWDDLTDLLDEWETWMAELMETHLSYPVLAYFRSQHLHQHWLGSLTTIVDVSAFLIAAAPDRPPPSALATFAIGRHALADLSYVFRASAPKEISSDRLSGAELSKLRAYVAERGLEVVDEPEMARRLEALRAEYEDHAVALAEALALDLPRWVPVDEYAVPGHRQTMWDTAGAPH